MNLTIVHMAHTSMDQGRFMHQCVSNNIHNHHCRILEYMCAVPDHPAVEFASGPFLNVKKSRPHLKVIELRVAFKLASCCLQQILLTRNL